MRGKFLVTRGMTKKATQRGRQQQMLLVSVWDLFSFQRTSTTWLPAVTQASAPRNQSLFLLLSSQQLLVVSQKLPQLWSYTSRHLTGCTDLKGKSLNLCLPALRDSHSLFSQCFSKYKILFLQLPVFQRCSSFWSLAAVKQLISPAQVLPPTQWQERSRLWGRQVTKPLCSVSAPAPAPALQRALLLAVAAQVSVGTCLSWHLLCPKHTHYGSGKRGAHRLLEGGEGRGGTQLLLVIYVTATDP